MKGVSNVAIQDRFQPGRVSEAEYSKTVMILMNSDKQDDERFTYLGLDFGAHTTAKDSGSIRWNPECVWRSTEDMKPSTNNEVSQQRPPRDR